MSRYLGRDYLQPDPAIEWQWQSGRYYFLGNGSATTTNGTANNEMRLVPFVLPNAVIVSSIGAEVTGAGNSGSKVRLGIYTDDGTGRPGRLVLDAGTIDGDSAAVQEITGLSVSLARGKYWAAWAVQSAASAVPTMRSTNAASGVIVVDAGSFSAPGSGVNAIGASQGSVSGALPATATPVMSSGIYPRIFVKT